MYRCCFVRECSSVLYHTCTDTQELRLTGTFFVMCLCFCIIQENSAAPPSGNLIALHCYNFVGELYLTSGVKDLPILFTRCTQRPAREFI